MSFASHFLSSKSVLCETFCLPFGLSPPLHWAQSWVSTLQSFIRENRFLFFCHWLWCHGVSFASDHNAPWLPFGCFLKLCLGISFWGVLVQCCSGGQWVRSSETDWTWRKLWDYGGNLRAGPSSCHKLGLLTLVLAYKFLLVPKGKATA